MIAELIELVTQVERGSKADDAEEIPCFDTYPAPPPTRLSLEALADLYEGNT